VASGLQGADETGAEIPDVPAGVDDDSDAQDGEV